MVTAVSQWKAADLEAAVVAAGRLRGGHARQGQLAGIGARCRVGGRSRRPPSPTARCPRTSATARAERPAGRPYAGVRVLDLTRVIAGPVATRFLAAYGADVLRLDLPGFAEVPARRRRPLRASGPPTSASATPAGRATFERLVAAPRPVTGLRADALGRLGYDDATLTALNPALVIASNNAYGWDGPWRDRRGFDSLVQMSCGIAAAGRGDGARPPARAGA